MNTYDRWPWGGWDESSSEWLCLENIGKIEHATGTGVWCKGTLKNTIDMRVTHAFFSFFFITLHWVSCTIYNLVS